MSKSSLTLSPFPPQKEVKVAPRIQYKSTRAHYTRAYVKRKMASAEQENAELRKEVGNLKEGLEKMAAMMEAVMIAQAEAWAQAQGQDQAPAVIHQTPADTLLVQPIPTVTSAGVTPPLMTESPLNDQANMYNAGSRPPVPPGYSYAPQYRMPPGYLWGMPMDEGGHPVNSENLFPHGQQSAPLYQPGQTFPRTTVTYAKPLIHTVPSEEEPVYHSDSVVGDDRMGNLEEKFDAVQRELKNIRGKDIFGQSLNDLCLVPNVVIPHKFKTPNFEKYKGDTCPQNHLIMYARKMQAYKDNEPLLIHCFQDSLAGPASIWFLNLKKVATFEELANAFVQKYKYNSYLAPNRRELQAMTQGEKESFKEYAQRFIQKSAQIRPLLDESEVTDAFFETLSPFYSKKMLGCASQKFTDMVDMGVRIEEWVRKGRVSKEGSSSVVSASGSSGNSSNGSKKFGNGYPKNSAQEIGMVAHGGSQPTIYRQHITTYPSSTKSKLPTTTTSKTPTILSTIVPTTIPAI